MTKPVLSESVAQVMLYTLVTAPVPSQVSKTLHDEAVAFAATKPKAQAIYDFCAARVVHHVASNFVSSVCAVAEFYSRPPDDDLPV